MQQSEWTVENVQICVGALGAFTISYIYTIASWYGGGACGRGVAVGVKVRSALMVSGPEAGCQRWLRVSGETVTQKLTSVRSGDSDRIGGSAVTMERAQG